MIEIEPELIRIISFPGIDRSIPQRVIEEGERFSARYYRNKRLGEFLRELDLSEGKSTGIPTIQEELRKNGSPKAMFFTDEDRRAVTVEIPIHPDFLEKKVAIEGEKVAIEFLKQRIDIMKVNANTKRKIRILLEDCTILIGTFENMRLRVLVKLVAAIDCELKCVSVRGNPSLLFMPLGKGGGKEYSYVLHKRSIKEKWKNGLLLHWIGHIQCLYDQL